ncbi:MAG TPA: PilZ domain-containing protein [Candidatus Limnocylindria bacterium]|nr:PilZ domain-containing protein [Candidatus Limnocylindria bacterium]
MASRAETSVISGGVEDVTQEATSRKRKYRRISLPKGMRVAWHGGDLQLFSRVRTLGMGGLFISVPDPPPVGTKLRLSFEVPGGNVQAEAVVRNIVPGEGMGAEFTRLGLKDRILLENLLKRLLR